MGLTVVSIKQLLETSFIAACMHQCVALRCVDTGVSQDLPDSFDFVCEPLHLSSLHILFPSCYSSFGQFQLHLLLAVEKSSDVRDHLLPFTVHTEKWTFTSFEVEVYSQLQVQLTSFEVTEIRQLFTCAVTCLLTNASSIKHSPAQYKTILLSKSQGQLPRR